MPELLYNQAFWKNIRNKILSQDETKFMEQFSANGSGYYMPDEFESTFAVAAAKENVFRKYGTIVNTGKSSTLFITAFSGTASFVESGQEIPADTAVFNKYDVQPQTLASIMKVNADFVADAAFDLEKCLAEEFAKRFGRAEESAFISGDGETEPTGILNPNGGAEIGVTAASASEIPFDEIMQLYLSLDADYRKNAVWLMNDETALIMRYMKDNSGDNLWRDTDDTILSRPVVTTPRMPTIAPGAKVIAFGDLSYYWMFRRQGFEIYVIWENYIMKENAIGFRASERVDGKLIYPDAIKLLQMSE